MSNVKVSIKKETKIVIEVDEIDFNRILLALDTCFNSNNPMLATRRPFVLLKAALMDARVRAS